MSRFSDQDSLEAKIVTSPTPVSGDLMIVGLIRFRLGILPPSSKDELYLRLIHVCVRSTAYPREVEDVGSRERQHPFSKGLE